MALFCIGGSGLDSILEIISEVLSDLTKSKRRKRNSASSLPEEDKEKSNDYDSTLPFNRRVTTEESLQTCGQLREAINKNIKEGRIDPNDKVWKKVIYAIDLSEETTLKVAKHLADLDAVTGSMR